MTEKDTNNKILAIVYSNKNKFLLLKTNPKTMKEDHWYVVTGAVKNAEGFKQAVKREVQEETRLEIIKIIPTNLFWNYEWPKDSGIIKHEKAFLVKVKHVEPKITKFEHLNYKWLDKIDFIKNIHWYGESKEKLKKLLNKAK